MTVPTGGILPVTQLNFFENRQLRTMSAFIDVVHFAAPVAIRKVELAHPVRAGGRLKHRGTEATELSAEENSVFSVPLCFRRPPRELTVKVKLANIAKPCRSIGKI